MDKNSARDTCLHEVGRAKSQSNALAQPHRGMSQEAESRLAGGSPRVIEPLPDRTQNEVSFRLSAHLLPQVVLHTSTNVRIKSSHY